MSYTDKIELPDNTLTAGYPKFSGLHLSMSPENSGWSASVNRILVFGGGAAGGQSVSDILRAFFNPTQAQTTGVGGGSVIGKQEASVATRFIYPGRIPFAMYFEYAGNDTASGNHLSFSKTVLSAGLQFPRLGPFDLTYEFSEWQPTWYTKGATPVQTGYGDGITNYMLSIGHWFGDQRQFGDAVGGQSNMLRLGWEPGVGGRAELTLRTLANDSFYNYFAGPSPAVTYHREWMGSAMYSYPLRDDYVVGAQVDYGRDVFGDNYSRFTGFLRFNDALSTGPGGADEAPYDRPANTEVHVDVGVVESKILADITSDTPRIDSGYGAGAHLTIGARHGITKHQDLGVAIEADDIHGVSLFSARMIDWRWRFDNPLAINLYLGAARYAGPTVAYGFYYGGGLQWRDALPHWDIGMDYRYGAKLDRLRVLPGEPQSGYRPDAYYDIDMLTLYVSRKF
jgi:hypothetical protein